MDRIHAKFDRLRERIRTFSLKEEIKKTPERIHYRIKRIKQSLRDASSPGKLLLIVGILSLTVVSIGAISGMIINALQDFPDYVTYFLHTLELYIALSMLYMLFEAVIKENEFQLSVFLLQGVLLVVRSAVHLYVPSNDLANRPNPTSLRVMGAIVTSYLPFIISIAICVVNIILSIRFVNVSQY
jgi:hypothetical protein